MDWYPHNIGDYDADTLHLSAFEDGVYSRLLRWYYREERPLPDDEQALANIARIGLAEWLPISAKIKAFFVTASSRGTTSNLLQHKRCNRVIGEQTKRRRDGKDRKRKQRKNGMTVNVTRDTRKTSRPKQVTRDAHAGHAFVSAPEERRGKEEVVRTPMAEISEGSREHVTPAPEKPPLAVVPTSKPNPPVSDFDPVRDMPAQLRRTAL